MAFFRQFVLLLWKNTTFRRRNKIQLIIEIIWPLFLFLILIAVRNSNRPYKEEECHFPNKAMPSAGTLPWIQSMICNVNNPCFHSQTPGETPGQASNFDDAIISKVLVGAQTLLSWSAEHGLSGLKNVLDSIQKLSYVHEIWPNHQLKDYLRAGETFSFYLRNKSGLSSETVDKLLNARLNFQASLQESSSDQERFFDVCNTESLGKFLTVDGGKAALNNLKNELCHCYLGDRRNRYIEAKQLFLSQLDPVKLLNLEKSTLNLEKSMGLFGVYRALFNFVQDLSVNKESLSSFIDLSNEMHKLSQKENENVVTMKSFEAFSNIMCGRDFVGQELSNSLNWYDDDDVKSFLRNSRQVDFSHFCPSLVELLKTNPRSRLVWQGLKPLFAGKLLYAPNTPAVQAVMNKVQQSFPNFQIFQDLNYAWMEQGPKIKKFMENRMEVKILQSLLEADIVKKKMGTTMSQSASQFLSNWLETYNNTENAIKALAGVTQCFPTQMPEGLENEDQLISRALELLSYGEFWAGVVFLLPDASSYDLPPHVTYKIRMDIDDVTRTNKIKDGYWGPGPAADAIRDMRYIWGGFVYVQDMVEQALTNFFIERHYHDQEYYIPYERWPYKQQNKTGVYVQQMPYPCYVDDMFLRLLNRSLPLFMTLAWLYSVAMIIKSVVCEKETRLKETMKIMGLNTETLWLGWFISSLVPFLFSAVLLIVILKLGDILPYSNPAVVLFFLSAFATATIMQCFLISTLFSKANLAAACGGLIYFSLYLPYVLCVAWIDSLNTTLKVLASFLSPVAFGFGCEYFSQYEEQGIGIQWHNLWSSPVEGDSYNFSTTIVILYMDAFIYIIAAWYIDAVFPGDYGIPRPWHFPFHMNYWNGIPLEAGMPIPPAPPEQGEDRIEPEPSNLVLGVSITNLVKIYTHGGKLAVNHLNLKFYEGQITSFLGHNGAGKTTTMSVLTGLFPPTSGTVYINGMDIRYDMEIIRRTLGVCPQHNVLFDSLTVEEHVWFYGRLKGLSEEEVKAEMDPMLEDVGLLHKRHEQTKNLSGGMQRKLSVAIAFVGGSKVVVLDEPTAGVDPYARRGIWDLLLKYRKDRTIILSTHYMDEAELLGDRIAIISYGKLCCCGTPLFLKSKLGSGYYLTVVKKEQLNPSTPTQGHRGGGDSMSISGDTELLSDGYTTYVAALLSLVKNYIPGASLVNESGREAVVKIPQEAAKDGTMAVFLSELDQKLDELRILSYGLCDSTLEEIFLRVAEETNVDAEPKLDDAEPELDDAEPKLDDTKPELDVAESELDVAEPELDDAVPKLDDAEPKLDDAQPELDNAVPELDNAVPEMDDAEPKLDNAVPELYADPLQLSQPSEPSQHFEVPETEPLEMNMLSGDGQGGLALTGCWLIWQQLRALFTKRLLYARRSRRGFFAQIVLPAVFVLIALLASLIVPPFGKYPALKLEPWMYGEQYTFLSNDATGDPVMEELQKALLDKPGFGTKCIVDEDNKTNPECDNLEGCLFTRPRVSSSTLQMFERGKWTKERTPDCQCSTEVVRRMLPECPQGAGGLPPPQIMRETGDILQNLTNYNISDFLVKTYPNILKKSMKTKKLVNEFRYGGFSLGGNTIKFSSRQELEKSHQKIREYYDYYSISRWGSFDTFLRKIPVFSERLNTEKNVKVWFNNKGWHAMVSFVNVMNNGLLRADLPPDLRQKYGITVYNHPLNLTKRQLSQIAIFVLFLIEERVSKAKHLQFVSGVKPILYWVAYFSWDLLNYAVPAIMVVVIFICFQKEAYVSPTNLPALILLLLLYGWSITPLMYPASFVFNVPSTAYIVLTCINLFIGINGSIATFLLDFFDDKYLKKVNFILKWVFLIFPHFCLGRALIDMAKNQAMADIFQRLGAKQTQHPFQWDFVGKYLCAMGVDGIIFFIFTILVQYAVNMRCRPWWIGSEIAPLGPEDEDVAKERERVKSGGAETDILTIMELSKVYKAGRKPAVNRLCLGIPRGECFGLLGINGAGKTTTFRMLTGDTFITSGEAYLADHSIRTEIERVHQLMGYCPQFDAISHLLTGREHLELFARLRGVPEKSVTKVAQWAVKKLGLSQYAEQEAGRYSGGNKRKLSTAIALIGAPPVIFLDEPTTGMDPKAKRFLWNCILNITKEGRAVVLTSHSMEECEALCTRMAIMVNGRFQCLGSVQHLKNRFGDGYTIILRLRDSQPDSCPVNNYMKHSFPFIELKEQHHNILQYQLPSHACCLARLFGLLANNYEELGISDFSVSQTTLDQVFVNFAKAQTDDDDLLIEVTSTNGEDLANPTAPNTPINPRTVQSPPSVPLPPMTFSPDKEKGGKVKTSEVLSDESSPSSNGSNDDDDDGGDDDGTRGVSPPNRSRNHPSFLFIDDTSSEDTLL
ncbi:phospholipid-transporting ATPase ABCA1-like isoform X2 [Entelurus aequoreus]|uniref:phospholipid-transporting ATPase ABCA1-like isoform X2 n=1 Tax=Entelurus aequoreus TaxID=161455 RepID=UPI002B1DF44E|nr:phospholipid-transporting ATPase ABCA1-like isoform X2 [Entelurus aequoreus]